jgi:hypothetical protein
MTEYFDRVWYVRSWVHFDERDPSTDEDLRARVIAA